jgi:CheY-like chemotaxis protein
VAGNGAQALDELTKTTYDLIFMDVQMPEMDGLEATKNIRQNFEKQPIIIAMTANAMVEDKEACINAGMNDYISKPFTLTTIVEVLEKWGQTLLPQSHS